MDKKKKTDAQKSAQMECVVLVTNTYILVIH
jgi:hypothetical protein